MNAAMAIDRRSRKLAWLLRHAPPLGQMDASGFVPAATLCTVLPTSESSLRDMVAADPKGRFELVESPVLAVRAVNGHTVHLDRPMLRPVRDASEVRHAIHVTSENAWRAIRESGVLHKMKRAHVHFATERRHLRSNSWATVTLRLDLAAALAAGLEFYEATNGVLLCATPVPVKFLTVIRLSGSLGDLAR